MLWTYFPEYPQKERRTGIAPFFHLFTQNEEHALWYRGLTLICFIAFLLLDKGTKSSSLEQPPSTSPQLREVELSTRGADRDFWGNVTTISLYTKKKPQTPTQPSKIPLTKKSSLPVFAAPCQNLCCILTSYAGSSMWCSGHPNLSGVAYLCFLCMETKDGREEQLSFSKAKAHTWDGYQTKSRQIP